MTSSGSTSGAVHTLSAFSTDREWHAWGRGGKRILDFLLAVILLVLSSPLWIILSICIRSTSRGPALYRQKRIGYRGREFVLYKFRTMEVASDRLHRDYTQHWISDKKPAPGANGTFKLADDPRVTSIGRVLRKYSLDEIPQLINVLRGEMSLVGPRPALHYEVAFYRPWHFQRLNALPGISGLWQVSGRNRLSFDQMVALDLAYIHDWSLGRDLAILLRTIPAVCSGDGH